ncbi:collagen-binding domain-containing protein [Arthrobacter sp. R4-81]
MAVTVGSAVAASATSGSPTCVNPLAQTHNFTVIVEDNAALGSTGAGGEIEGSLASGGDVSFGLYNLLDHSDGSALPTIGSSATQLLVGGSIDYSSGQKLDLNAGFGKITDTSGLSVTADGRLVQHDANRYVKSQFGAGQSSLTDYTAAAETYSQAFPADYFNRLRTLSTQYAALTEGDDVSQVSTTGSGVVQLVLQEGETNVWSVSATSLAGVTAVNFDGATPSDDTRLVINVIPDGSADVGGVRFNGDPVSDRYFAPWVVWNFEGWENLRLVGATEMSGMLLAPDAALDYNRNNPLRGQILAESINITAAGEIHHWSHAAAACTEVTVTPSASVTPTPDATVTPSPEVTVTPSSTPEPTVTRPGQAATLGPTSSAGPTPSTTAPVVASTSEASAPSTTGTLQSASSDQLAETGFDRAWIVAVALVLMLGGALAVGLNRRHQGKRTAGNRAGH